MRLHVLALIALAGLLLLVGRLWMLQLTNWAEWARAAAGNRESVTYTPAPRGIIFDRNNAVLAENRPVWNVSIIPSKFPRDEAEAERVIVQLAGILGVPSPELREKVKAACSKRGLEATGLDGMGEDIPFRMLARIEEQALPGVVVVEASVRSYPFKGLAAHVLGYARGINDSQYEQVKELKYPFQDEEALGGIELGEEEPLYSRESIYGQAGLEKQYEIDLNVAPPVPILSGRRGRTVYEVDAAQRPVRLIEQRPPVVGASVYLTMDVKVQQAAEEALRGAIAGYPNRTGAAVCVDVEDGGIIAIASLPAYNPNDWVKRIPAKQWAALTANPRVPLMNKATSGEYPPASTFKMISMSAALDRLKCTPEKRFYCSGGIHEGPLRFGCWKHGGHGSLNFRQALAQSCDVFFYEVIRQQGLSPDELSEYARMFGLGEKTGLDVPEERAGLVPSTRWKRERYDERWWTGDSLNMVIGQGATSATPLQMAMVCATVANGGDLLQPHLLNRIAWPKHLKLADTVYGKRVRRHVDVRPETLQIVREGMRLAVVGEGGTAGALRDFPIRVAGKTGSAEHMDNRPPHAWFVCFAPYEKPKYAIAVFVSEGEHGGSTAAPVARKILAALYNLKGAGGAGTAAPSD
ncbi:MAG: penicillin-binding protein 2 [Armatimonadia bacterium]